MSRIVVTGATGFIGARIAERLSEGGHELGLLLRAPRDTDRAAALYSKATMIYGDLAAPQSYAPARENNGFYLLFPSFDNIEGALDHH